MSKKFNFFKEAVKNYKTSGTVVPSSKYLANKMLKDIDFSSAKLIVELGPGNGAITHDYEELIKIKHPQLIVLKASAENIKQEVIKLGFDKADYIVSSLPLTIIPKEISHAILT